MNWWVESTERSVQLKMILISQTLIINTFLFYLLQLLDVFQFLLLLLWLVFLLEYVFISKVLIDSNFDCNEFVSVNNVLKE